MMKKIGHTRVTERPFRCLDCRGVKILARMVWGTYNHQRGILTKLLNSVNAHLNL